MESLSNRTHHNRVTRRCLGVCQCIFKFSDSSLEAANDGLIVVILFRCRKRLRYFAVIAVDRYGFDAELP